MAKQEPFWNHDYHNAAEFLMNDSATGLTFRASAIYATFLFRALIEVGDRGNDPETIPTPPPFSLGLIYQSTELSVRNELK